MNIHRALLGVFDGEPYLGSLDFLSGQARLAAWPSATQQVESEEGMGQITSGDGPGDYEPAVYPRQPAARPVQPAPTNWLSSGGRRRAVCGAAHLYGGHSAARFMVLGEYLDAQELDTGALASSTPPDGDDG